LHPTTVWTSFEEKCSVFSAGRDLGGLFFAPGDNAFMIKVNRWSSL